MLPSTLNLFRQSSLCLALTAAGLMASVAVQADTVLNAGTTATGTNSTAIGANSKARGDGSSADSTTLAVSSVATASNTFSVGFASGERRILINETDAVNKKEAATL